MRYLLLALLALFIVACSTTQWHVHDAAGQVVVVSDPYFEPRDQVVIRVGKIERNIEANQIEWLRINPGQLQTDGGRIFYGARLQLRDGSRFPDSSLADSLSGVMIGADGSLAGDVRGSRIKIPIAQLREFATLGYEHKQDSLAHPRDTTLLSSSAMSSMVSSSSGISSAGVGTSSSATSATSTPATPTAPAKP